MGYWYQDCYIDADTLKGQREQEAKCRERVAAKQAERETRKPERYSTSYADYLWRASPVNLTPEERKDREKLIEAWKWNKEYDRKKQLEKEQWHKTWAWAWGKSYVYFILDPDRYLVKIGYSKELPFRFKRLQAEYPSIVLKGAMIGGYQDEQEWHKVFSRFRVEGEWFELSPLILDCIKRLSLI